MPRCLVFLVLLLSFSSAVLGAEVVTQNDSAPAAGGGVSLPAFVPGENAAVWLTAAKAGDIVAVQVDWRSMFGGAPSSIETAIYVFRAGTFPTPGPLVATITTPTLFDGMLNEYRHLDPGLTIPLQVPVAAGEVFVVAIEFLNSNAGGSPFVPSVTYDADGCQLGLGSVLPMPGPWTDTCLLGVPGDIVIRAVIDEPPIVPSATGWQLVLAGTLMLGVGTWSLRHVARGSR